MKACIIQTEYSFDYSNADSCFSKTLELLENCDSSMDVIVLPEYCDVPVAVKDKEQHDACVLKYNGVILEKAAETAKRCNATVFVNAVYNHEKGQRNTTYAINRNGETVGKYFKAHPAPSEFKSVEQGGKQLDVSYADEFSTPYTVEIDGIRYGFMTCYDFYFYESFAPLALQNVDVIIGCSHQRTDTHHTLEVIDSFLCYNTNAYLLRASVSLGEDSSVGGCSMIVSPEGIILENMKNRVGIACVDIDPKKKHYKPAGYNGTLKAHYQYIEQGRRPQNYRQGGSSLVADETRMPYPRICAHRGFNSVAPENSMPAFGAAVALGASEIEFDLWLTTDGVLVSSHDPVLERVSNGEGKIYEKSLEELKKYDFGIEHKGFEGLEICLFEDILKKFACRVIMNIHVKNPDLPNSTETNEVVLNECVRLIKKYGCEDYVYFMSGNDEFQILAGKLYPGISRCMGAGNRPWEIVDRAIEAGCNKVQLFVPYFNREMIDKAHAHGIKCNVFFADTPEDAQKYLDMGADTVLTNDYLKISRAVNLK